MGAGAEHLNLVSVVEVETQVEQWHCHSTLAEVEVVVECFHGPLTLGAEVGEEGEEGEVQSAVFVLQKT